MSCIPLLKGPQSLLISEWNTKSSLWPTRPDDLAPVSLWPISLTSSLTSLDPALLSYAPCINQARYYCLRVFARANLSAWNTFPPNIQMLAPSHFKISAQASLYQTGLPQLPYIASYHSLQHSGASTWFYFHITYEYLAPISKLSLHVNGHCGVTSLPHRIAEILPSPLGTMKCY